MAQHHANDKSSSRHAKKGRGAKNNKNNQKHSKLLNVIIWGVVLAILTGAVIYLSTGVHEHIKRNVKTGQFPLSYSVYVDKASKDYNLDPALIYAIIRTESGFNTYAESPAGAYGLMQITDETFEHYMNLRGESGKYTVDDLFTPSVNIDYGCNILSDQLKTFCNEECAVAAYNAGPGNVEEWLNNPEISPDGNTLIVENIPFEETRNYVERVEDSKNEYIYLYFSEDSSGQTASLIDN